MRSSASLLGAAILSLVSCSSPSTSRVSVSGQVQSFDGQPVPGATVSAQGTSTKTGVDGRYRLDVPSSDRLVLRTQVAGYGPQVSVIPGKTNVQSYDLDIAVVPFDESPFDAAIGIIVSADLSIDVVVPPGIVPAGGNYTLRVASYQPESGPGILDTLDGGDPVSVQSFGMVYVDIIDVNGATVTPTGAGVSLVSAPFTPADVRGAGPVLGWQIDDSGRWAQPSAAGDPSVGLTFDGLRRWLPTNFDRHFTSACARGHVRSDAGGACAGKRVRADSLAGGISAFDAAGQDGSFCVNGAPGIPSMLVLGGVTQQIDMPATQGNCMTPKISGPCYDVGEIVIPAASCPQQEGGGPASGPDSGAPEVLPQRDGSQSKDGSLPDPCGVVGAWNTHCESGAAGCAGGCTIPSYDTAFTISPDIATNGGTWQDADGPYTFAVATCSLTHSFDSSNPCFNGTRTYPRTLAPSGSAFQQYYSCWDNGTSACLCTQQRACSDSRALTP